MYGFSNINVKVQSGLF
uniref:Uncharacterized protein n=1 Tax=Rhizophora mucronata TaxID=61149 RepID=A0A2P2P392_RHIMU